MLAKLELKLKCEKELTYQMSSLFHGALMELLPEKYADYLHISSLHPYAQHLECREGNWCWVITGLNKEAGKECFRCFHPRYCMRKHQSGLA
jgi:CRISPR-associated endoribonuclease Cas6